MPKDCIPQQNCVLMYISLLTTLLRAPHWPSLVMEMLVSWWMVSLKVLWNASCGGSWQCHEYNGCITRHYQSITYRKITGDEVRLQFTLHMLPLSCKRQTHMDWYETNHLQPFLFIKFSLTLLPCRVPHHIMLLNCGQVRTGIPVEWVDDTNLTFVR